MSFDENLWLTANVFIFNIRIYLAVFCCFLLTVKVAMTGRGSFLEIPLDPTQAKDNRNGLVKHIYGQVNYFSSEPLV